MFARFFIACLIPLGLAGCAPLDPPARFEPVQKQTRALTGSDLQWARTTKDRRELDARVAELLREPLTANSAVQIALLQRPGLQARLHELGIADAELVQASRLPNPGVTLTFWRSGEWEGSLVVDLLRLLRLTPERELAEAHLKQVQLETTQAVLQTAASAERAYWQLMAARQMLEQAERMQEACDAAAELARRAEAAGNFSALRALRELGFAQEAALTLARARSESALAQEAMARELGISNFTLPEHMPALPMQPLALPDKALEARLDVQASMQAAEVAAKSLGLTRRVGFVNVLEVGAARRSGDRGAELRLELPLFDWGEARNARAESVYAQALAQAAEVGLKARAEIASSHQRYLASYTIARRYRDEVLPVRARAAEQNLKRYNAMLISVLDLLADAREQSVSVQAAIAAERDFHLAESEFHQALWGSAPW